MSFDYDYKLSEVEQYVNNTQVGKSFPQKVKLLLLCLVNGTEHVENIRNWIDNFSENNKK